MPDTSPTARALRALELLQARPGITADQLGAALGVTERAARRYVAILREADIPVESVRGPYGGYRVGRGLRLPPLVFSATEALGLVMAALDAHRDPDDVDDPVGSALGKIVRALPEAVAAQAEAVRRTAAPAPDRGAARPDPGTTTTLVRACGEHRLLRIGYRTESGRAWETEVEPWAVVVRHGRWYLLCHRRDLDARRAYRVDRVTSAEVLVEHFPPPPALDPVQELEDHLAAGWEFATEVHVAASPEAVARILPRHLGRPVADPDGGCRIEGSTSNPAEYAEDLARLPYPFRILGGPELRSASQALVDRVLAALE
ncbi:helix-turn-helix transcriptional regulator [Nocardioides sp. GXQ0305]|uniref:helix-turn-helix transcriptional regulator n=1 Tax=Nocardioides sp. GXQ0305 TaxID=3423912 RepID=UPI003D7C717A